MSEFRASAILRLVDQFTRPARRIREALGRIARTENFRNLSRALRNVRSNLGNVLNATRSLGRSILFGGGAFGGGVLFGLRRFAGMGDRLAKTSRQLGIGVEALQEFRFAADRSGISVQMFDSSLERFVKRTGEAAQGTGDAARVLKFLGVDLHDANDEMRSTEDLLLEVLDKINGLADEQTKSAAAAAIFGREGLKMVNLAAEGADGIQALRDEARHFGVASEETARKSENFIDAVTNLNQSILGLKDAVAGDLLPAVTGLMKELTEWLVINRDLAAPQIVRFVREFGAALSSLAGYAASAFGVLERIANFFDSWVPIIVAAVGVIAGPFVAAVVGLAGSLLGVLVPAIKAVSAALLANPIVAIAALLAAGAVLVIRNWDDVANFFSRLGGKLLSGFEGFLSFLDNAWSTADTAVDGFVDRALAAVARFRPVNLIRQGIEAVIGYLTDLDLMRIGIDFMASFWRGVQSFVLPDWLASRLGLGPAANVGTRVASGPAAPISDAALQAARPAGLGGRARQRVTIEGRNIPAGARLDISTEAPDIDLDAGLLNFGTP